MKVLIAGANGQLGRAIRLVSDSKIKCYAPEESKFDVTDSDCVLRVFDSIKPDAVINCAAYTSVDRAETDCQRCFDINVNGTKNLVKACEKYNSALMLLSTDYVFDGYSTQPYETMDFRNPLNVYGRSKMLAEDIVLSFKKSYVVRTSWMFGDGQNFVRTICGAGRSGKQLRVVDDQIGSPTYAEDLAPLLLTIISDERYNIYHITNEGYCSWADLAEESLKLMGIDAGVERVNSAQYNSKTMRPYNSRLSKCSLDEAGYDRLPSWLDGLKRYIDKYGERI